MRDLKNLYVRANTCVACHQNVDADLLQAGHPELIFELDGQAVSEPKHWRETTNWNGAQAWLIGQQVALREMSWQLASEKSPTENHVDRWSAVHWVVQVGKVADVMPTPENLKRVQEQYDQLARQVATVGLPVDDIQQRVLPKFASASADFRDASISQPLQARRAERLVLALDRLVTALPELDKNEPAQSALKQLFKDAQSLPDFSPSQFAGHLQDFQKMVATSSREANKPKAEK